MIWFIIGYVFMGVIGHLFLTGLICGIVAMKRGYYGCYIEFIDYVDHLSNVRMDEQLNRWYLNNDIGTLIWLAFHIATWPVEFVRCLFLDIPDAIEHYESQYNKEEQA